MSGLGQDQVSSLDRLIERVALGDRDAYRTLYDRSAGKLFALCLRILADRHDAEEALQEAFVKVWNKAALYDAERANGMTWLSALARNQAIDLARTRSGKPVVAEDAEEVEATAPGPMSMALRREQGARLEACLAELEGMRRQAVQQTYLAGWTYQQAAEALDVPLNTVKTWVRRSLLALRECVAR